MRVVHLKRTFLKRTETFVFSQLVRLRQVDAVMLTRDLENTDLFSYPKMRAFCSETGVWSRRWSNINYRALRRMSGYERRFFHRELCDLNPDLFHAHYAVDAAYFADVVPYFDRPLVVSCYGYDVSSFPRQYWGYGRHYLQRVFKTARLFLAMSEDMKRDLVALGVEKQRILVHHPNGVELERFRFCERRPGPGGKIRLLCVGTFMEYKGIEYLIAAFAKIRNHTRSVELRLVGDGPLRPAIVSQIKRLGLEDSVILVGFVDYPRLVDEYNAAHLFCLPSVTSSSGVKEGIPTVLVEAQATGLPVVATWHAGIPEVVVDGRTGYLVGERDADALAARLIELIDHPNHWGELGCAGREHVAQQFDADLLAQELERIYERVHAC